MFSRWIQQFFNWLSNLSDGLSRVGQWPERLIGSVLGWFGALSSGDRILGRFFGFLLAPFRYLVDRLDRLGPRVSEKAIDRGAEERKIASSLAQQELAAKRQAELSRSWVSRVGRAVLMPLSGFSYFFWLFVRTRGRALWWWATPLVIVLLLISFAYFQARFANRDRVAARYEVALSDAIRSGDTEQADLFRLKLEQLGVQTDRGAFRTALAMAETGDLKGAYQQMVAIASPSQPGFPGAHFWIAQQLIDGRLELPANDAMNLALLHLQQLKIRAGNQPEIFFLEGLAHYRLGQFPAAINALQKIEIRFPAAAALLMELHQRNGSPQLAREQAVAVHRQLQQMVAEGETLTEDQLRWQSAATGLIGDSELAQAAVDQWYRLNPNSVDARQNRAAVLLARFDRWVQRGETADLAAGLNLLLEAANITPTDKFDLVRRRLQVIARTRGQSAVAAAVYDALLADEKLNGLICEYLGTAAAVNQDWATAERLLRRATINAPDFAVGWNNLAFVLSSNAPQRRGEALEFADRAIALDALNVDYRETRGMIYFHLKRWDQAIEDLEIAINGARDLNAIHLALAESYRQIGNTALADVYQRQVRRP